jgi:UDP-N-acetylglucosamine acyltransferase
MSQNLNGNTATVTEEPAPRAARNPKIQLPKQPYPPLSMPLGYDDIRKILPHRYPFLLVDRIVELEPGVRCVGVKSVTINEEFFQGHFPGRPVMPGVLLLEAMAQVAGVLTLVSRNSPGALSYFASIEKARFRRPVQPGDQFMTEATLTVLRGALCKVSVVGRVDGQVMVEAEFTFMTADESTVGTVARASGLPDSVPPATILAGAQTGSTPAAGNGAAPTAKGKHVVTVAPREDVETTFIHPTAMIDPEAQLDERVWIGPYCVIEGGTQIGAGSILESNVVVKRGTSIGQRCRIWPNVVLGHEPQDLKFKGEESFVVIGDDNTLREMVTIHRATGEGEKTTIGDGNVLMAYAHVGHNCIIGDQNMISNSTGISGHVTIEDKTVIGGFVGVHQFVHIGRMAMVGGLSKVVQDVPPFCMCDGRPAKIHGLNIRGLRRNGVPPEQRNQVSAAFKLLYRSKLNTAQAMEEIRATIPTSPTLEELVGFIERVGEGRLGRQDETPHL